MNRKYGIRIAQFVAIAAVPLILWAHASGPDAHHTAVPQPSPNAETPLACTESGCHVGTALNGGGGNVAVSFPIGQTYSPGARQTFTVTITDSAARRWGFQMTARLGSDLTKQAGTFSPVVNEQIVLCAGVSLTDPGVDRPRSGVCPANRPLEFIEHGTPYTTNSFTVTWNAPATDVGPVNLYISANAANGNATETGDHIYNTSYVLQSQNCTTGAPKPTILAGGVINAGAFGAAAGVAPGSWIEIYGDNLASTTRDWAGDDFNGSNAPTDLSCAGVKVNGKPAVISHIGPGQVNAQVPDDIGTGPVQVIVSNKGTAGDPLTVQAAAILPGLLAPPAFATGGKQYVVALSTDGRNTFVGLPSGFLGGRPAKPGEVITLYGIGFGPTTPAVVSGTITSGTPKLTTTPAILLDQTAVNASAPNTFFGLAPGAVGLYQFNFTVPNVANGDHTFKVTIGSVTVPQTLFIQTQQ